MGTGTPSEGRENGATVKAKTSRGSGFNRRNQQQNNFTKKEKFMGAHPDLHGFVSKAGSTRCNQIAKFTTVNTHIHTLIRQQFNPLVLASIEKMTVTMPPNQSS
jgi:hypothetical protein